MRRKNKTAKRKREDEIILHETNERQEWKKRRGKMRDKMKTEQIIQKKKRRKRKER